MADTEIVKKNLLLGQDNETLISNANENFNTLFDEVDSLGESIAAGIDKNVNDLVNYVLKDDTGTSISLSLNTSTYVMTLSLLNTDGTAISTQTIDFPLESVVVGASYDKTNKQITLTLQNGNTTSFSVSDLVSGLVPDSRKVNGKTLSDDITLTQDDVDDGTSYKRFSKGDKEKLDKFNVDDNGNLTYDGNEIGKVKDVKVNGNTVVINGVANIDLSAISVDGEPITARYDDTVTLEAVNFNNKDYKAIVIPEGDVSLEVLNSKGKAVVTQVIKANGNIYYCLPSDDEGTYTLRKVGGNEVGSKLYLHSIYATTSEFVAIPSYITGNNTQILITLCFQTFSSSGDEYADLMSSLSKYIKDGSSAMLPINGYFVAYDDLGNAESVVPIAKAYIQSGVLRLEFAYHSTDAKGTYLLSTYLDTNSKIRLVSDTVVRM